ncbi:MAG TPA: hypothetical protein VD772_02160 [Anseongella sp.]|nr:hypothetical protein [Anseongella sp.]
MSVGDYLPVPWDFREMLDEAMQQHKTGLIHYFSTEPEIERARGRVERLLREPGGEYLLTESGEKVRLDKIITLFGQPGPAFDDYESYGNACMSCSDDD